MLALRLDTELTIYVYHRGMKGSAAKRLRTGFVDGFKVHLLIGEYPGYIVARALARRIGGRDSYHQILREGLPLWFDGNGRYYRAEAASFLRSVNFIALNDLVEASTFGGLDERMGSIEMTSVTGYILSLGKREEFKELWQGTDTFERDLYAAYDLTLEELEDAWIRWLKETPAQYFR